MICGSIGRSPATALTGALPAISATIWRTDSGASAPSAPTLGSFASMKSAPCSRAILASSALATLARKPVNSFVPNNEQMPGQYKPARIDGKRRRYKEASLRFSHPRGWSRLQRSGVARAKRNKAAARQRESEVAATASRLAFLVLAAIPWATGPAKALDPRYPDWPCQQLKVPGISIASVWTGPAIEPTDTTKPVDAKEADFVSRLAARRTPIEDARKLIADYVVGTDAEKREKAKTLFTALYVRMNSQRDQVMNGI